MTVEKKYLDYEGLKTYDSQVKKLIDTKIGGEKVTVDTTTTTSGYAKSYTFKQGTETIGTVDIPKDMVVSSGEVKTYTAQTLPTGTGAPTSAGTYLVLTLANATNDKVYINVGTLVDIYKAKAGIIGFTKSLAKEVASRNITVNAVAPGFIETQMTAVLKEDIKEEIARKIPLKRMGTPQDVANAVKFLASSDSSYITGQVIHIDGGMLM